MPWCGACVRVPVRSLLRFVAGSAGSAGTGTRLARLPHRWAGVFLAVWWAWVRPWVRPWVAVEDKNSAITRRTRQPSHSRRAAGWGLKDRFTYHGQGRRNSTPNATTRPRAGRYLSH